MAYENEFLSMHVVREKVTIDSVYDSARAVTASYGSITAPLSLHLNTLEIFPCVAMIYRLTVHSVNRDLSDWDSRILLHDSTESVCGTCILDLRSSRKVMVEMSPMKEKSLLFTVNTSDDRVSHWVVFPLVDFHTGCYRLPLNMSRSHGSQDILTLIHQPRSLTRSTSYITFTLDHIAPDHDRNGTVCSTPIDDPCISLVPSRVLKVIDPEVLGYKGCEEVQLSFPECKYLSIRTRDCVYVFNCGDWTISHVIHANEGFICPGSKWVSESEVLVCTSPHTTQLFNLSTKAVVIDSASGQEWPVPCTTAISPDGRIGAEGTSEGTIRFFRTADGPLLHESRVVLPVPVSSLVWVKDYLVFSGKVASAANSLPVFILAVDEPKRAMSRHLHDWSQKWIGGTCSESAAAAKSRIFASVVDQQLV